MTPVDPHAATGTRELNYYQAQYLTQIKRVLRHAEQTRRDEFDSWRNDYEDHVRWLIGQLERRLA